MTAVAQWDHRGYRAFHWVVLAAGPFVQLLINPNIFVTPGGNGLIDPWVYTGFFLSLPDFVYRYPQTYYGARLPWLIPGYAVHSVFSPLVANYVLHIGFFGILLTAAYLLGRDALGRRAGMLMALALAWNPIVWAAVSWDYIDGAGIVFSVVALLCLERGTGTERRAARAWSAAAGFLLALLVSLNLFLAILLPLYVVYAALRLHQRNALRRSLPVALFVASGSIVAFVLLAAASRGLGAEWLYIRPQLTSASEQFGQPNPWKRPGRRWIFEADWLVLAAVASVAAMLALWFRRLSPFAWTMQIVLLGAAALWILAQSIGMAVLDVAYYSSYLAPFALIALTAQLSPRDPNARVADAVIAESALLAGLVAMFWILVSTRDWFDAIVPNALRGQFLLSVHTVTTVGGLLVGGLLALFAARSDSDSRRWLLGAALLVVLSAAGPRYIPVAWAESSPAYFRETVAIHRFIQSHSDERPMRIWFRAHRQKAPVTGVTSSFLFGYSLINYDMPNITSQESARLPRPARLVLLVDSAEEIHGATAALRSLGFTFSPTASQRFVDGEYTLEVVVGDLT